MALFLSRSRLQHKARGRPGQSAFTGQRARPAAIKKAALKGGFQKTLAELL